MESTNDLDMEMELPLTPRGSHAENLIILHTPGEENGRNRSDERVNPFDRGYLENLACTFWSPSVFDNVNIMAETPEQNGWDVHQMALLFPKPIEDSPSSHMNPYPIDPTLEAKAQATIDKFFNSGPIAPSPEEDETEPKRKGLLHMKITELKSMTENGKSKKNAWVNTVLSLPPDLPQSVEAALAPYFLTESLSGSELFPYDTNLNQSGGSRPSKSFSNFKSVRRRLELSFGEVSTPKSPIDEVPYGDPFENNHFISSPSSTPPNSEFELEPMHESSMSDSQFSRCICSPIAKNETYLSDADLSSSNLISPITFRAAC